MLADAPAAQADAALVQAMQTMCRWLQADDGFWVGGVRIADGATARRDPQHGWRGRIVRRLHPTPVTAALTQRAMREQDNDPGMTTRALTSRAGVFRVHRLRDGFIDFSAFRRTAHYRAFYESAGIVDRLWVALPVNQDTESHFVFDHIRSKRRFRNADAHLIGFALRGIKWFHRQLLLSHGLLAAQTPLSPAQRRVLLLLLTGKSEKAIAAALGFTVGTTHQYVAELFRKFGVNGRAGLMALWLGR
jgi:DNA-binding CsgD family transcriptional regulator